MNSLSEIKKEETIEENQNFNVQQNEIQVKFEESSFQNTLNNAITQNISLINAWSNYVNFQNKRNYLALLANSYYNPYKPTYLLYFNQHNNLIFQHNL